MEDGRKREVRASRMGHRWRIQSRIRGETKEWTEHDPPAVHDLQALLDLLRRKHQRRRASPTEIEKLEKWIQTLA